MTKNITSVLPTLNILTALPPVGGDEAIATLLTGDGMRVERIVSYGHVSPPGFWYDQNDAEWVLVISGCARLSIEGEASDRDLGPGDSLFLPAHCRHRVAWTRPRERTVWLAVFVDPRRSLEPVIRVQPSGL